MRRERSERERVSEEREGERGRERVRGTVKSRVRAVSTVSPGNHTG